MAETVHACPPGDSGIMPCCGRTPFEVLGDRMSVEDDLVTCIPFLRKEISALRVRVADLEAAAERREYRRWQDGLDVSCPTCLVSGGTRCTTLWLRHRTTDRNHKARLEKSNARKENPR